MNITEYLGQCAKSPHDPDFGPWWGDRQLSEMLGTRLDCPLDTTDAAKLWASIANGEADVVETLLWVQYIAQRINANVIEAGERDKAPAALKAIGFYGRADVYREARESMLVLSQMSPIDDQGNQVPNPRRSGSAWVRLLKGSGYLAGIDDKTAVNKANEWRKELGID